MILNVKKSIGLSLLFFATAVSAQNPIVPAGKYCSDPQMRTWNGQLYIYGSRDESRDYYCSYNYDVWSTKDMKNWTEHPNVFISKGKGDEVPYNDELLFAPDCMYRNGKYYLYFSQGGSPDVESVAESDSPVGPFKKASLIRHAEQIDPSVYIDDDGQAYLFWGQFACKGAKLKPNMREIDPTTIHDSIITEKNHFFHEGSQLIKHNGWYYLVYADIQRRGMPTCIGYSMSRNVFGPYEYKGIIVDNFGCDPYVWNNHGSIGEFNGQWYVFYHRSTNGSERGRKACVEPIHFNPDGTINEVEMTTQGAAGPLNPFKTMEAWRACYLLGNVRVEPISADNDMLTHIENQNAASFKYFDFPTTPRSIEMKVVPQHGGRVEIYANTLSLPLLATIQVPEGDGKTPITLKADVDKNVKLTGVHPIFLRFRGDDGVSLFKLDSFRFNPQ